MPLPRLARNLAGAALLALVAAPGAQALVAPAGATGGTELG